MDTQLALSPHRSAFCLREKHEEAMFNVVGDEIQQISLSRENIDNYHIVWIKDKAYSLQHPESNLSRKLDFILM